MRIEIKKVTNYKSIYTITRVDKSVEEITLETKTYFVHDICHFVVEKNLGYTKGFWGMLSQGYTFNELFGKENPLTAELRFIEKIVGPIQSTFLGQIPKKNFTFMIEHLDFKITEQLLDNCLTDIKNILNKWKLLPIGQQLILEWKE